MIMPRICETIYSAARNIRRKRFRSLLTMLGIAIGVLSVVIITMIGDIGKTGINNELDSMGISGICLRLPAETGMELDGRALSIVQANPNVAEASPLLSKVTEIQIRKKNVQAMLWGVDSGADKIVSMELLFGRLINKSDVSARLKVCIVDEAFAIQAYGRSNIVGKSLKISTAGQYIPFEVIGVVSSGGNMLQSVMGQFVPNFMYAPFSTLGELSQKKGFSQIVVKLTPQADEKSAASGIGGELTASLGIKGLRYENLNGQKEKLNGILDIVTLVLSIIGGISLVVAGLSIMTVMLVTVNERTREIGIKKSIGANKKIILCEFLTEALLLSFFGSIIGTVVGVLGGSVGCALINMPPQINIGALLFCILFSVLMGCLFGVYPAMKAASLKPVDALRCE